MSRVPPVVFVVLALLGLVVAVIGLVVGWAEVTPVAFFVLVFFSILATIRINLMTEPIAAPVVAGGAARRRVARIYDLT
jgi:hypothetical protein